MKKEYELVGFVNLLNIRPGFVYPVFCRDGRYYFQHGENNRLLGFEEINKDEIIKQIIPLIDEKVTRITIDSKPIYAYQRKNESIYYSEDSEMEEYINKKVRTQSDNLQKEIDLFIESINNNKIVDINEKKGRIRPEIKHIYVKEPDIEIKDKYPDWAERYRLALVPMIAACDEKQDNPEIKRLQQKHDICKMMILGLPFTEDDKLKIEHAAPEELTFIFFNEDRLTTKGKILIMVSCKKGISSDSICAVLRYAMTTVMYKMKTMHIKEKDIALIFNSKAVSFSVDDYLTQKQAKKLIDEVIRRIMLLIGM